MAKVSIAQAAKMVGISRTTMYRKFINSGTISVEANADGAKQIDTSELMRVFGTLNGGQPDTVPIVSDGQLVTHAVTPNVTHENKALEAELKAALELLRVREEQLDEAKEREAKLWHQVNELTLTVRLIEDKTTVATKKHWWWFS